MIKDNIKKIAKWLAICVISGICFGVLGAVFSFAIEFVTKTRIANGYLIYFLPIGGILTVLIYKLFKTEGQGTNDVLLAAQGEVSISPKLAPSIFLASALSHLFGASVGREGAALQLGGSLAAFLSKIFKLKKEEIRILTYCGMAGVFSAVFGTPFAAFVFALEVAVVGKIYLKAVLPTFFTSFCSFFTAKLLGAHAERFPIEELPKIDLVIFLKVILISVLAAFLSVVFCYILRFSAKYSKKVLKNPFLRIVIASLVIILLSSLIGTRDYCGAGIEIIEKAFLGEKIVAGSFILKLIFTSIAVSAGFKGGEIIPTLFIGATFGVLMASLLGLPLALGALVGLTALFCGVTNCMFASILLSLELCSGKGVIFVIIAAVIAFFLSGKISLYTKQKHNDRKFNFPYEFEK